MYEWKLDKFNILIMAKGGGSSGGSSGRVDYPDYMKNFHEDWLTGGIVSLTSDITTLTNGAIGNSPYISASAYDPTGVTAYAANSPLDKMDDAVVAFDTLINTLDQEADWDSALTQAATSIDGMISDSYIATDAAAFGAVLDDQIENVVTPRFQRGMQDINAVQTSSFTMGLAFINGMRDRDVAQYQAELRSKLSILRNQLAIQTASDMIKNLLQRVQFDQARMHYTLESNRLSIVALKEQTDANYQFDDMDAKWDLEMFQYGANFLSAIGGTAVSAGDGTKKQSAIVSAIGGALSGAGAGAQAGPWGAVGGAIIGGAASFL